MPPLTPARCPCCRGTGLDLACFAIGDAVHYAGSRKIFIIEAWRFTHNHCTPDRLQYLIAQRGATRWVEEALLVADTPHQPPEEPCTCRPGTSGWAKHHGTTPGTLPRGVS